MIKVKVLSHYLFDRKMIELGLNDDNVENSNNAYISIIGTEECIKYWIQENDRHYFKDHPNVLNLEFDDISDNVLYNGHLFQCMSMKQAESVIDFIEKYINEGVDTIYIHCRAGMSRSRAVGELIYRYCKDHEIELEYSDRDDYTTVLNHGVLRRLNHAYWKKHKENMYENDGEDYPEELINPNVMVINRKE